MARTFSCLTHHTYYAGLQTSERGWYIEAEESKLRAGFNLFVEPNERVEDGATTRRCHSAVTGLALIIPLAAPAGSSDITPLTSLMVCVVPRMPATVHVLLRQ